MDPIVVSKIWVGMSTNNIDLLQFKSQGHLQNEDFECRSIEPHFEETKSKIFAISVAISHFFLIILLTCYLK